MFRYEHGHHGVVIYKPPSNYKIPRVLYARTVLLNHTKNSPGTILATWENYSPEPPYFPIHRSTDQGKTWKEISRVYDQVNGWGLRYQPFLYELTESVGDYEAGTILLSGSAIPEDLAQTQIDLYASTDSGVTWKFVSHVARGGKALPDNGLTPVWEPFLMVHNHKLVLYYSDQRDPKHGQKLVHQVTSDLKTWEPPVDDTSVEEYKARPGMTTIAELPNGQFILTFEWCGADEGGCPVHYRLSKDPLDFQNSPYYALKTRDRFAPNGSPYVVWTPEGGSHGTIVVSSGGREEVFINKNLGNPGDWVKVSTGAPTSYTRSLMAMADRKNILIVGGGVLNGKNNTISADVFQIPA
ncbi:BNR/Asp-box repeat protein [Microthyrium microscopicum]|uniref:BNR/Asp-box repeat protein n=1 Tax=Microthyrium microscopicum TaxID=703497 RepID=A0A6A6UC82_9PEZI|nr:BNR/Asp-box repeat protein [Microthyrium microscopicum]